MKTRSLSIAALAVLALMLSTLSAPAANALPLLAGSWAFETAVNEGDLSGAHSVAVNQATGEFYVTDVQNHTLTKYNRAGEMTHQRGQLGVAPGNFDGPRGVAVAKNGDVYVADTGNNRIQRFNSSLIFQDEWGEPGTLPGEFSQPFDVAVHPGTGQVFVTDLLNHRVQKFDADGTPVDAWGGQGQGDQQFLQPRGIAVTASGNVVVADTGNNRVKVLSSGNGAIITKFGHLGQQAGDFSVPTDVTVDQGRIYVSEFGNHRVQAVDEAGQPLAQWAVAGDPQGIAMYAAGGAATDARFYVAAGSAAVLRYRMAQVPTFPASVVPAGGAGRSYSVTVPVTGFPVVTSLAVAAGALPPGTKLSGTSITGVPTKPGSYPVTLRADNGVLLIPLSSRSLTISVAKAKSRVTAKLSTKHPKKGTTRIKARIVLSAPNTIGLIKTGKVRVYYGKKRVKTYTVKTVQNGRITVRLPKFTKTGKTRVTLRYLGNTQLTSAKRTIYVRVR